MEIFHISAECYPAAKVGGLADVVGALPKYQSTEGHDVRVVIPGYDTKFINENEFEIKVEYFASPNFITSSSEISKSVLTSPFISNINPCLICESSIFIFMLQRNLQIRFQ